MILNSGHLNNRIDIKDRNLSIPAGFTGVQRPGTLMAIENSFQVLLL
jgi:hypothetical protein